MASHDISGAGFGTCCENLSEALAASDFEPLLSVGDDGVLYVAVGLVEIEDDNPGMIANPVFYCPFCGTHIQTAAEVKAKVGAMDRQH